MLAAAALFVAGSLTALAQQKHRGRTARPVSEFIRPRLDIRTGLGGSIVSTAALRPYDSPPAAARRSPARAGAAVNRPRLVGFSPLIAITSSDKRSTAELETAHVLEPTYAGNPLNPPASVNYVVGILDSGAVVDLAAGTSADRLGLTGSMLTPNVIPIGGVGGTVDALITQPFGVFAAGLSAVDANGVLDLTRVVGHSNVAAVAAPPIVCGNGETLIAVVGTPFIAFYNSVIRVDSPIRVTVDGRSVITPDVAIQDPIDPLPQFPTLIPMEFGGLQPATTAAYFPNFEDFITPITPTQLALSAVNFPFGGVFFTELVVQEGNGFPRVLRVLVDTGAQSSIISRRVAALLGLPLTPDFEIEVCGVGGLVGGVPGYYVDSASLIGFGGGLEFVDAPFVVIDLESPEGGSLDGVLGMNFFWNRNIVFEPSLTGSAFLHVSDPIPVAFGDEDIDFDVDAADYEQFFGCLTTAASDTPTPECKHMDADLDARLGLADFAQFQICFSGADVPADGTCGAGT